MYEYMYIYNIIYIIYIHINICIDRSVYNLDLQINAFAVRYGSDRQLLRPSPTV